MNTVKNKTKQNKCVEALDLGTRLPEAPGKGRVWLINQLVINIQDPPRKLTVYTAVTFQSLSME